MAALIAAVVTVVVFLALWWCVFAINREDRLREDFLPFPDRDDTRMWDEIRAVLSRPVEGDK